MWLQIATHQNVLLITGMDNKNMHPQPCKMSVQLCQQLAIAMCHSSQCYCSCQLWLLQLLQPIPSSIVPRPSTPPVFDHLQYLWVRGRDTLFQDIDMQEIKISKVTHTCSNRYVHVTYMQGASCYQTIHIQCFPTFVANTSSVGKFFILLQRMLPMHNYIVISQKIVPTNNTTSNQSWWVS